MVPYWPDGEASWKIETPLLHTDISSAPRLSAFAFEQQFGFELDLIDLSLHLFATEPATPDIILPETIWKQRLRGVAATAINLIKRTNAEIVFVPHGAEVISRILAAVASALGHRVLFWESGFFPGQLYLDPLAPHFFRGAARIDALTPEPAPSARAYAFQKQWKAARHTKYPQAKANSPTLNKWLARDSRPVLFLPGQVPSDANAVVSLNTFDTLDDLYQATLDHIPADWRVLYKPHPLASLDPLAKLQLPSDKFLRVDVDVHDALQVADAVLVHSSNVGLEALLYGKPVLTLGRPIYSGRGLTIDLDHPRELPTVLAEPTARISPPKEPVLTFLDLLLDEALIADNDVGALLRRIDQAPPGAHQTSRLSWYGQPVQALAEAARAVHKELRTLVRLDYALEALPSVYRQVLEHHVGLKALEPHRFGGPIVPRNRYAPCPMPDLTAHLGSKAVYRGMRLEHCVDPVAAINKDDSTCVFALPPSPSQRDDAIQSLSESDLVYIANKSGRKVSLFSLNKQTYTNKISSDLWAVVISKDKPDVPEAGTAAFRPWKIPLDAFELAEGVRKLGPDYIAIDTPARHPIFGPFLQVPAGVWEISWDASPVPMQSRVMQWLRNASRLKLEQKLRIEWVEHLDREARVLYYASYEAGVLVVTARPDAVYECRVSCATSHKSRPKPIICFRGITLRRENLSPIRD